MATSVRFADRSAVYFSNSIKEDNTCAEIVKKKMRAVHSPFES